MVRRTLTDLRAEDVMIYGDTGKGYCPRIADCTPCEGEEKHMTYAQAEWNAKRLVKLGPISTIVLADIGRIMDAAEAMVDALSEDQA